MLIFDFDSARSLAIFVLVQASSWRPVDACESLLMRSTYAPTAQMRFAPGTGHSAAGTPPAFDPEIAKLFAELRRYLGLPVAQVAHQIGTHPNVIAALEAGRIDLLPGWSETARVVVAYIAIARLDPRPALERLSVLMGVARTAPPIAPRSAPYASPPDEAATPVARILGRFAQAAARAKAEASEPGLVAEWVEHLKETANGLQASLWRARAPVRWVIAAALALIVIGSAAPSAVLQASVGGISQPISGLWRKISGQTQAVRIILRDGLKWIEADDPRERRSDKLPSRRS
jgi:hypothetical protein